MQKRCAYCLSLIGGDERVCPVCGKAAEAEAPFHQLPVGTLLRERYYLGAALGQGGFGITYAGYDTLLERKVAVKEYFPNGFVSRDRTDSSVRVSGRSEEDRTFFEKGKKRFLDEAHILAGFSGLEGVVDVHDCFTENNTVYIVMAFIEGVTLKEYLRSAGKLSAVEAVNLLMPVMTSLKQIHRKGLIHRDISPDNIMLTQEGNRLKVRLIDFGAARNVTSNGGRSLSVVLKPGFAPIEQYGSRGEQGAWTDVYALCATIYTCVTGTVPDAAPDRMQGIPLKAPSEAGARIDAKTERVLMKGMALSAADRYRTIDAFLNDLLTGAEAPEETEAKPTEAAAGKPAGEPEIKPTELADGKPAGEPEIKPTETADGKPAKEPEIKPTEIAADPSAGKPEGPGPAPWEKTRADARNTDTDKTEKKDDGRKKKIIAAVAAAAVILVVVIVSALSHKTPSTVNGDSSGGKSLAGDKTLAGESDETEASPEEETTKKGPEMEDSLFETLEPAPDNTPLPADTETTGNECGLSEDDRVFWSLSSTGTLTISGSGRINDYRDEEGKLPPWHADHNSIKEVIVENGVTEIGYYAFYQLSSLTSVSLPDSLTTISMSAFEDCTGLVSVTIPKNVTEIGMEAFRGCSALKNISLPENLHEVSLFAFDDTAWYNAQPDGIVRVGNILYKYKGKISPNQKVTIGSDIKLIAGYAFSYQEDLVEIEIPDGITKISEGMFSHCSSLNIVRIPSSVTEIGAYSFSQCENLTSVSIPSDVTTIDYHAFENCTKLTKISIPDSITKIRSNAFENCAALMDISIPKKPIEVGQDAFLETAWYNAQPDGMAIIGNLLYAYKGSIPPNGTITIPTGVNSIVEGVFKEQTGLIEVIIPGSLSIIGRETFSGCTGLTNVTISEGVTKISVDAFQGCTGLKSVTIPASITDITAEAFIDCTSLEEIIIPDKAITISKSAFKNTAWYNAQPDGIVTIGSVLYSYKGTIPDNQKLTIGRGIKAIAGHAFEKQEGLVEVVIPDGVTLLGYYAFSGCTNLKSVTIPESVIEIKSDLVPSGVTIYGKAGSYAETWAKENGRTFVAQ